MPGKFASWLLVSDFDDTLRPEAEAGPISRADREALERFMAEGGRFTVATGRDLRSYLSIQTLFPHNAPAIVGNGAVIAAEDGSVLWESFLPERAPEDLRALLSAFPQAGAEVHRGARVSVVRRTAAVEAHLGHLGMELREQPMESVPTPWNKIVLLFPGSFSGRCPEAHAAAARVNEDLRGYTATPSGALVDLVVSGCDKGQAARRLLAMPELRGRRLAAVGDSWNDLPLLLAAERAYAPRDAAGEVRREPGVRVLGACGVCLRDAVAALEAEK